VAHTPSFTIFGPFGGPSVPGWNEDSAKAQTAAARQFQGVTSSSIELVQSHLSDKLIVLIMIERNVGKFAGFEQAQQWETAQRCWKRLQPASPNRPIRGRAKLVLTRPVFPSSFLSPGRPGV
jgi:hypothetical protein